jgi:hypothetical protein
MLSVTELWYSVDPVDWDQALLRYWQFVKPRNLALEQSLDRLDLSRIRKLDGQGWYHFLLNEYFRWKYTAENRYATTTSSLRQYNQSETLDELFQIKEALLSINPAGVREGLLIARRIKGLGVAGASGLLSLMYPGAFGTVDQFVVKALRGVERLPEAEALITMDPEHLTIEDGILLIAVMRRKAAENNDAFATSEWTPRKIDQILWTYGR